MPVVSDYTALISGYSFNGMAGAAGAPVFITYAFLESSEVPSLSTYQPYPNSGYTAFTNEQRTAFRQATDKFEAVAGIQFIEVDNPEDASILIMNTSGSGYGGWANYGFSNDSFTSKGYIVIDGSGNYGPGTYEFETLLHELGHAMGLKHPFDGATTLVSSMDNENYTLMSYTSNGISDTALASLDVAALRAIYGQATAVNGWTWSWSDVSRTFTLTGGAGNDRLIATDARSVVNGNGGNDTLWGRDANDTLNGGEGDDTLFGGDGTNVLNGGNGNDRFVHGFGTNTYIGGGGTDTIDFSVFGTSSSFSLAGNNDIENITGSAGNDYFVGNDLGNWFRGGAGGDYLDGAGGFDTVDYSASGSGVVARLWNGTGQGGEAQGDTLVRIENVVGSHYGDTLIGDATANVLNGGVGNDYINGLGGNDTLIGSVGADNLFGDAGIDTAVYTGSNAAVTVKLWNGTGAGGHAQGDRLTGVENVTGSAFHDSLIGNNFSNWLRGEGGNDYISGLGGNDVLTGGAGSDRFAFGSGWGADLITDWQDGTDRIDFRGHAGVTQISHLTITASGADALIRYGADSIVVTGAAGMIGTSDFIFT